MDTRDLLGLGTYFPYLWPVAWLAGTIYIPMPMFLRLFCYLILILVMLPMIQPSSSPNRYNTAMISYCIFVLVTGAFVNLFIMLKHPRRLIDTRNLRYLAFPTYIISKLLGLEIIVNHQERLYKEKKCILAFNHQSFLDFIGFSYAGYIRGGSTAIVCKKEIKYFLSVGINAILSDMMFVDRMSKAQAFEDLMRKAEKHMSSGSDRRAILICPEGTRGPGGEFLPFKRGAFEMAMKLNVPIQPIIISPYPVDPPKYFRRGKVIHEVMDPIWPLPGETTHEYSDRTKNLMFEVYKKLSKEVGRN